jgi:hypothetical protein
MAKSLSQLIKERPMADELGKAKVALGKLDDRAAAILAIARLENALEDRLVAGFVPLSKG